MEKRIELEKRGKDPKTIKELVLDNCRSTQIVGLTEEFSNLETLSLVNVGLTNLKGFPKLPNLLKLELSDNRISGGLNHLIGSPKLTSLKLGGNKIDKMELLEPLKELKNLKYLELSNNGVTSVENYREKMFNLLPNLNCLDGYDKNDEEVDESEEENGINDKYEDSDLENEDGSLDDDADEEEDDDVEDRGVGLSYLENQIDEESEGDDYSPGELDDDDDEDIDSSDEEVVNERGTKRKLDSED